MKLKLKPNLSRDINYYYQSLPNGLKVKFRTKKEIDSWFAEYSKVLNQGFKTLLLNYPYLTELYTNLFIRSNVQNPRKLGNLQKLVSDSQLITTQFGKIPLRNFYEVVNELLNLIHAYEALLKLYRAEYMVYAEWYTISQIDELQEVIQGIKNEINLKSWQNVKNVEKR